MTPHPLDANDLLHSETKLKGAVIELSRTMGGTSGRFEVARIAARVFPVVRPFVQQVIDEGFVPKESFAVGPYPDDTLTRRSDTEVEFVTSSGSDGLGTDGRIAKNNQPIAGVAILLPDEDMDLVKLDIRLPPEMRDLASAIITTVEANKGSWLDVQK